MNASCLFVYVTSSLANQAWIEILLNHNFMERKESLHSRSSQSAQMNKRNSSALEPGERNVRSNEKSRQGKVNQPTLVRLLLGYLISISNTIIFAIYLFISRIHLVLLSQTPPILTFITLSCFAFSCSLGIYVLVSNRHYDEQDPFILLMSFSGVFGWCIVLYALWMFYENIWIALLIAFWSFISFGIFIGMIWPRGIGYSGTDNDSLPTKEHESWDP